MKNLFTECEHQYLPTTGILVNDLHSQLNPTTMKTFVTPHSTEELSLAVRQAAINKEQVSICGGRHAMGGQQFLPGGTLIDIAKLNSVINFDDSAGLLRVQAGIKWPEIIQWLKDAQAGRAHQWTIAQKQTGCDALSIGGAISANIHGRGLTMPPFVADVEDFTLVLPDGSPVKCSRSENRDLFRLATGGYGLFGAVADATIRLVPRSVLQRRVRVTSAENVVSELQAQIAAGAKYGDFQFSIDHESDDFLNTGILSTYSPVAEDLSIPTEQRLLSVDAWKELVYLAHTDKSKAFQKYSDHYLRTDGQLYLSDTFQLATYLDNYHSEIDARGPATCRGTELISELYVPRHRLAEFLKNAAFALRSDDASVIYGTVRLIEKDTETFLPWAREGWACTVLNLHVDHTTEGLAKASLSFRALINEAIALGGSYYLTYHKFATRDQLLACYPRMPKFLELKEQHDPDLRFSSSWYNYCRQLL
jgi:FAD/FMN-containing dehydrogenase